MTVADDEVGEALESLWGRSAVGTWNPAGAAVGSWLSAGRAAVLLFAGDLDPSGVDLERDFLARTACWDHAERVSLTAEHVREYDLPPQPGKGTDPRATVRR
ncbi:hypothetical protein [Saccharopolyspora sp. ASAGF58]|uniref:hypothetical protein n=1 Tax=Saccharopolyspora sp. ASAGF58 TaxID=2719023 RepID=UPI001B313825|nr:hypothetical protein [Saccharopolyspora sp. ASAGF58]